MVWIGSMNLGTMRFIDEYDNVLYTNNKEWDGSDWVDTDQMFFYYQVIISNNDLERLSGNLQVYPNPSDGNVMLDMSDIEIRNASLRIYNALGQVQHYQPIMDGTEKMQANLSQLQSGIYQLQIESNNQVLTQAIQIIK